MSAEERYEATPSSGFKLGLFDGETAVARLVIGRYTMQVAGAGVTMGGIADVVTHPAHRGKGYGAQMLRAAVARMREEGYALSVLFGISDFYHRFGYAPVLPEYAMSLGTRHAERFVASKGPSGKASERVTGVVTVRPGTAADAPALLALYTRVNAGRNGTLHRTAEKLDQTPRPDQEHWWPHPRRILVAEQGGRPAAYALLSGDPSQFRVSEVVIPAEHVTTTGVALLEALTREAVERRLEQIRLPLPPDEPLAVLLRQAGCKIEVTYPANGGGMGRIVDLAALTQALQPALTARAQELPAERRPGSLELTCTAQGEVPAERAHAALGGEPAARTVRLALPLQQMCQLVMGYQGIDALRWQWPDACSDADAAALRVLFPAGYPHMWAIDHF